MRRPLALLNTVTDGLAIAAAAIGLPRMWRVVVTETECGFERRYAPFTGAPHCDVCNQSMSSTGGSGRLM